MKYTVFEIEEMRRVIWDMSTRGSSYRQSEMERTVEARLLTYIANETTLEELKEARDAHVPRYIEV